MILIVDADSLHRLLCDLTDRGLGLNSEIIYVLPWDQDSFRVKLTRSQVRRLKKKLPVINIEERYGK